MRIRDMFGKLYISSNLAKHKWGKGEVEHKLGQKIVEMDEQTKQDRQPLHTMQEFGFYQLGCGMTERSGLREEQRSP